MKSSKMVQSNTFFASQEEHAKKFISWLDETGKCGFKISLNDINKQFASSFGYYVNGDLVATDSTSLLERFSKGAEEYASACINFPLINLDPEGSMLKAKYQATFTKKNGDEQKTINTITVEFDKEWKVKTFTQSFDPSLAKVQVAKLNLEAEATYNNMFS